MNMNRVTSVEDYKIVSSFQSLRKTLLEDKFADRLEKPLAYWALPNDRRLPLAFLGRTIKDLLETPFEELSATPGIGQKKISSLVKLLSRATKDHPPAVPFGLQDISDAKKNEEKPRDQQGCSFDPAIVSEVLWAQWCAAVREHAVGREKLGRLAPSLQSLPTVIWNTPLEHYMNHTVAEIRQLKTHGEKRVRVVLEVFCIVHEILAHAGKEDHLAVRLVPKFTEPLADWISEAVERQGIPAEQEIREKLVGPLLEQIRIDAGETVFELASGRLGMNGAPESVRQQARRMGVTRARVYQLLEDCAKVMGVRWPEGQQLLETLAAKLQTEATDNDDLRLYRGCLELFYPGKQRISDEELEA